MIVSLGEALIDFVYTPDVEGGEPSYRPKPGGSPMNTAVGVARLGVPAAFVCKLSTDFFGEMLVRHIKEKGVIDSCIIRSPRPSTLAFARIENKKAEYAFFTQGAADGSIVLPEIETALSRLPASPSCIQIGSISLILEPGASAIEALITGTSAERDFVVSFDPNIRASMVTDRESYLARLERLFAASDIVKISDEDLFWIYPDVTLEEGARKILEFGTTVCAVTEGKKGSWWFSQQVTVFDPPYDVVVVDTIGAGDTFHAGLLAYLYDHDLMDRSALAGMTGEQAAAALAYADKAAGLNCSRQGASPPSKAEMEAAR